MNHIADGTLQLVPIANQPVIILPLPERAAATEDLVCLSGRKGLPALQHLAQFLPRQQPANNMHMIGSPPDERSGNTSLRPSPNGAGVRAAECALHRSEVVPPPEQRQRLQAGEQRLAWPSLRILRRTDGCGRDARTTAGLETGATVLAWDGGWPRSGFSDRRILKPQPAWLPRRLNHGEGRHQSSGRPGRSPEIQGHYESLGFNQHECTLRLYPSTGGRL